MSSGFSIRAQPAREGKMSEPRLAVSVSGTSKLRAHPVRPGRAADLVGTLTLAASKWSRFDRSLNQYPYGYPYG